MLKQAEFRQVLLRRTVPWTHDCYGEGNVCHWEWHCPLGSVGLKPLLLLLDPLLHYFPPLLAALLKPGV